MVKSAAEALGGLDIIIANAAWTRFEDKFGDLDNGLTDEEWNKVRLGMLDCSLLLITAVLVHECHAARANNESRSTDLQRESRRWCVSNDAVRCGNVVSTGHRNSTHSCQGIYPGGSSMPYSVTKAAGVHLTKCLAFTQGPKIRVNAILPGLLLTEWVCEAPTLPTGF